MTRRRAQQRMATLASILIGFAPAVPAALAAEKAERPHILVILADDLGWNDVGYHGSEIATPHIDRIASQGIELDRFYVQPTCSPTRAALMTGKSPLRLGIERPISKNEHSGLPLGEALLPEQLARLGYQSLMVGKWHLGHYTPDQFPQARGFEHFYGNLTGGVGYWDHNHGGGHDWQRNGETLREEGYATRLTADEAVRVLGTRDRTRPVFLYVAFNAPHLPNEAPAESIARHASIPREGRRVHAAMVGELDDAIGRVLQAFADEGLLENTLVFFSSDNGGLVPDAVPGPLKTVAELLVGVFGRPVPFAGLEFFVVNILDGASDNSPLQGGKGGVGEGGSRVPAAFWWPGALEGGAFEGFMSISDLLPTLLEAIGAQEATPGDLDGRSQWRALRNEKGSQTPDYATFGLDGLAIYRPPWKLIDPDSPRLYHIYDDPTEQQDVSGSHPEIVESLASAGRAWPRGPELDRSFFQIFQDPDRFGGPEDREPWADVAKQRSSDAR